MSMSGLGAAQIAPRLNVTPVRLQAPFIPADTPHIENYLTVLRGYQPTGIWLGGDLAGSSTVGDLSGNGHTGTAVGGVALGEAGPMPKLSAGLFDGTTGHVDVPSTASLNVGAGPYAFGYWFRTATVQGGSGADIIGITGDYSDNWWVSTADVHANIGLAASDVGGNLYNQQTAAVFDDSAWHLAVSSIDRVHDVVISVDGVPQVLTAVGTPTTTTLAGVNLTNANPLGIGLTAQGDILWTGSLAGGFLIVGTALSAAQIRRLYLAGRGLPA